MKNKDLSSNLDATAYWLGDPRKITLAELLLFYLQNRHANIYLYKPYKTKWLHE